MEYKKFKDEQPEAGRLVEVVDFFDSQVLDSHESRRYDCLSWISGVPCWRNGRLPLSGDEWRYSSIGEPTGPCHPEEPPTGIVFKESQGYLHGVDHGSEHNVYFPSRFVFDTLLKIAIDRKDTQQAAWNNHINPPASQTGFTETTLGDVTVRCYVDGRSETRYNGKVVASEEAKPAYPSPESYLIPPHWRYGGSVLGVGQVYVHIGDPHVCVIEFKGGWKMYNGKWRDCLEEHFISEWGGEGLFEDWINEETRKLIGEATPAYPSPEFTNYMAKFKELDQRIHDHFEASAKDEMISQLTIKNKDLEGALRIKDQAIDRRNETNDFLVLEIQARDHVLMLKDKKISDLMVENAKIGFAALGLSEEA